MTGPTRIQILTISQYRSRFVETGADHVLIDVRSPEEFAGGHIPGAINLPLHQIASGLFTLPGDHPIAVVCANGYRSRQAAQLLANAEFSPIIYLQGGTMAWVIQGWPLARGSTAED